MKPANIILILADDMGYSDIGCFGSEIPTPNIDRIAREGVSFTQGYNCARCCPSRASLLTGLYPHQAGVGHMVTHLGYEGYEGFLNQRCVTIAEALRASGYQTFLSGKWHVGGNYIIRDPKTWAPDDPRHPIPTGRGFDEFFGTLAGCGNYYNPHTLMRNDAFISIEQDDFYYTDAISDEAVRMIDRAVDGQQPFFLFVSYTAPHWPLHAREEDISRFEGRYQTGWDTLRMERYERLVESKLLDQKWKLSPRDEDSFAWETIRYTEWEARRMAVYAAQIFRMDLGIGRILAALERQAIDDKTMIMFMSDNGGCAEFLAEDGFVQNLQYPMCNGKWAHVGNNPDIRPGPEDTYMSYDLPWANASNTPFRLFKHWVHEGGISTPILVRWPVVGARSKYIPTPVHFIDIMPTCLEIAGATYPEEFHGNPIYPLPGESLVSYLRGEKTQRESPLFWEHEGNCAVRSDDWKLVKKFPGDWELYNFEQDRTELHDLSKKNPPLAKQLQQLYNEWAQALKIVPWERLKAIAPE